MLMSLCGHCTWVQLPVDASRHPSVLESQALLCSQNMTGDASQLGKYLPACPQPRALCQQHEPTAWHMPAILVLWKQRQEQEKLKVSGQLLIEFDQNGLCEKPGSLQCGQPVGWQYMNRKCISQNALFLAFKFSVDVSEIWSDDFYLII